MKSRSSLAFGLMLLASLSKPDAQCASKVLGQGTLPGDEFGSKIVMAGRSALIGAYEHDGRLQDGGLVHVYERRGNRWIPTQRISPTDALPGDWFGFGMGMDEERAVISSHAWRSETGKATVFRHQADGWVQEAVLVASGGQPGDWIGIRCDLDGRWAVLGAPNDDDRGTDAGAAYVFERTGAGWVEVAKLVASNATVGAQFGFDVALDGDMVLVGAWRHRRGNRRTGAAYVFEHLDGLWTQTTILGPAELRDGDGFGIAVSLSKGRGLVGARGNDEGGLTDSGCAYLYERSGGAWTRRAKLLASQAASSDEFGNNVVLDGSRALIGAYQAEGLRGRAHLFEEREGQWVETRGVTASDGAVGDLFGYDVALSGERMAVGAFLSDASGDRSGAAYFQHATELGLLSSAERIAPAESLTLSSCDGTPGALLLPVLTSIRGRPTFLPLSGLQRFDAQGSWCWTFRPGALFGSNDLEIRIHSRGALGGSASNAVRVRIMGSAAERRPVPATGSAEQQADPGQGAVGNRR